MRVLLLEDDFKLNEAITNILYLNQCKVDRFYNGEHAYNALGNFYDLYLLDINVPEINGLEILKKINSLNNKKVIIISADHSIDTICEAYQNGCIDFIKKPFHLKELELKLQIFKPNNTLQINSNITFNIYDNSLILNGDQISLTKKERVLLKLLAENDNEMTSYETLYHYLYEGTEARDALRALIKRLRHKIGQDVIQSCSNEGYRLNIV